LLQLCQHALLILGGRNRKRRLPRGFREFVVDERIAIDHFVFDHHQPALGEAIQYGC
jgi:hypothetical protein